MSKDNFIKRPKKEINFLIKVINEAFKKFTNDEIIKERGVNIKFYGV
jgi:undecaprenyl pyrophosphate synthase